MLTLRERGLELTYAADSNRCAMVPPADGEKSTACYVSGCWQPACFSLHPHGKFP
jgi:hypothetical protein